MVPAPSWSSLPQVPTLPFGVALFLLPFGRPRGLLGVGASLGSCWRESTGGLHAQSGSQHSLGAPADPARAGMLPWGTGSTGHTGIGDQTPGTGSCVSFSWAQVTFSTPSITHSAQLDNPHGPSAQIPLAVGAAAEEEVSGKAQITFSAGK